MNQLIINILFFILFSLGLVAQNNYPQNYFKPPVDIPIYLSGTFGELRKDHFHSGMDIRTGEVEGLNIYAIADGYVSRIKISSGGYGKAIYITHKNGYVSVYGHLQQFNSALNNYVKDEQYRLKSFAVDLYPEKNKLIIYQGEVFAISGNTGRSGGPHLHFEIRDEASQKPINPLFFGFKVKDITPPVINLLKVYPTDRFTEINSKNSAAEFFTQHNGKKYSLLPKDTIEIAGKVFFGINTYDPFNNGNNKNGVYSIQLFVDSALIYEHNAETFSFYETRFINSLIDYKEYIQNQRRVQKSYIQPGNHLSIYKNVRNNGIIEFKNNKTRKVKYIVSDIRGNESTLIFYVKESANNEKTLDKKNVKSSNGDLFSYQNNNIFKTSDLILEVPGKALYDTLNFIYQLSPGPGVAISDIHHLHFDYVPLHTFCNLSIWPDSIPTKLHDKALIARIEEDNEYSSVGGNWVDGFINTRIRNFGKYIILVDTIPPIVKPINIYENKNLAKQSSIKVKIEDELSGIKSYVGTLNNNWILMEYDEKNDLLIYTFDEHLQKGENSFRLQISDEKNNKTIIQINLVY